METIETVQTDESLNEFASKLVSEIESAAEEPPKRKRGRPRGSKNTKKASAPKEESPEDKTQEIAFIATMTFQLGSMLTDMTGTRSYTPEEAQAIAAAALPVLEKYGDSLITPEIALLGVAAIQVMPRYIEKKRGEVQRTPDALTQP